LKRRRQPDHVGLVESFSAGTPQTIEFNTTSGAAGSQSNGGLVARRQRPLNKQVAGFIRPELERVV
jgi:hypothetical protein